MGTVLNIYYNKMEELSIGRRNQVAKFADSQAGSQAGAKEARKL